MVQDSLVAVDPGRDLIVVGQRSEVVLEQGLYLVGPVGSGWMAFR